MIRVTIARVYRCRAGPGAGGPGLAFWSKSSMGTGASRLQTSFAARRDFDHSFGSVVQRFALRVYQFSSIRQERAMQRSTNPLIVVSLIFAARRIRSDSSVEHLRRKVVLGPGGLRVPEGLRFNGGDWPAFPSSSSSKSTDLMTMFST